MVYCANLTKKKIITKHTTTLMKSLSNLFYAVTQKSFIVNVFS